MLPIRARPRTECSEEGNIAILTVLALVVLLGSLAFATDLGMAYLARQRLVSSLDAGALAGLSQVFAGTQTAVTTAENYVKQNGEEASSVTVDPLAMTVTLTGQSVVPLYFGRVLGVSTTTVAAQVQASAGALISGTGFAPVAIVQQAFVYGQSYALSRGAGSGSEGNYGYLALGGTGASVFAQNLLNGYAGTLSVGEQVETEPGVMAGPVSYALNTRLETGSECSFSSATTACSRVMLLPVIANFPSNGRSYVTIVGFAAFYLDGLEGSGGHQVISGRFLQMIIPGNSGAGAGFGLFGVKLTQ